MDSLGAPKEEHTFSEAEIALLDEALSQLKKVITISLPIKYNLPHEGIVALIEIVENIFVEYVSMKGTKSWSQLIKEYLNEDIISPSCTGITKECLNEVISSFMVIKTFEDNPRILFSEYFEAWKTLVRGYSFVKFSADDISNKDLQQKLSIIHQEINTLIIQLIQSYNYTILSNLLHSYTIDQVALLDSFKANVQQLPLGQYTMLRTDLSNHQKTLASEMAIIERDFFETFTLNATEQLSKILEQIPKQKALIQKVMPRVTNLLNNMLQLSSGGQKHKVRSYKRRISQRKKKQSVNKKSANGVKSYSKRRCLINTRMAKNSTL